MRGEKQSNQQKTEFQAYPFSLTENRKLVDILFFTLTAVKQRKTLATPTAPVAAKIFSFNPRVIM